MEALLLVLVCAAPWAYGAVHPGFEFLLDAGVFGLLLFWAGRIVLRGRLTWKKCPVAVCLAGLVLVGLCQVTTLSRPLLGWLSPRATQLYDQLLPDRPEQFPEGEEGAAGPPAGSTLSLYPAATRKETIRLLAVFLVFALVRNNLGSPASLRRLCIAAVLNGCLLSLFALVQFFTSPRNTLYWRYPSQGQVFGPFVNRNHFAFYLNLCIGPGVGLLLSRRHPAAAGERRWSFPRPALLHDPAALWLCAGLALMAGSVLFSLSRGGMLALAGMVLACVVLGWRHARSLRLGTGLLVGGLAAVLAGWLGFGLLEGRLETLWKGEALENRLPVWQRALGLVADFPLCGSGYGTFLYLEPLYRTDAGEAGLSFEHIHNEFLEVLAEGGVVGLLLAVLAVGMVYRLGLRALVRHQGRPAAGLALGCLIAFTGLVLHSLGEFGTHVPAIALLAAVLCAHLCALGSESPHPQPLSPKGENGEYVLRLGGIAPMLSAAVLLALGLLILDDGWRAHGADRWKVHALRAGDDEPDQLRQRCAALERAVALTPDDAPLQRELGYARLRLYEQETIRHDRAARPAVLAALVGSPAAGFPTPAAVPAWAAVGGVHGRERERRYRPDLAAGLRAYLRARDACPLLGDAHLALAGSAYRLGSADSGTDYLRRVKLLAPGDPETWYRCGLLELNLLAPREVLASWRRCLELSDAFLGPIVDRSALLFKPREMAEDLLPDRADTLVAAAYRLFPGPDAAAGRQPFLDRAGRVLEAKAGPLTPPELHARALILQSRGRREEAAADYQTLVSREPTNVGWRFEFARLLCDLGRWDESRRQLLAIRAQDPNHSASKQLLATVTREVARKE
jgi:O-antigen ligase/tetratricopeptide (TPR) repeat protein